MANKQSGFTLVELVVVIVVVGLLAVAALPRFLDVTDEAKKASIEGVAGGYATGVLSARAQWEAQARPSQSVNGVTRNSVNYDGVSFWLTSSDQENGDFRDGYPFAIVRDSSSFPLSLTNQACIDLMDNLLQNPPRVGSVQDAASNSDIKYTAEANDGDATCTYTQKEGNSDHQFVYEIETGRVTVTLQ